MPGCHCGTCRRPPRMPTRVPPRCDTTGRAGYDGSIWDLGSGPNFVKVLAALVTGGEQDALAEQGQAGPAEHLALDHLDVYVESELSSGVAIWGCCYLSACVAWAACSSWRRPSVPRVQMNARQRR